MEHTHFSPLGMDTGHTGREPRVTYRGPIFGRRRQETGGQAESQPESKRESAEQSTKSKQEMNAERKRKVAEKITTMNDKLKKAVDAQHQDNSVVKKVTDRLKALEEKHTKSQEINDAEIKEVEASVSAFVERIEANQKLQERAQKTVTTLEKFIDENKGITLRDNEEMYSENNVKFFAKERAGIQKIFINKKLDALKTNPTANMDGLKVVLDESDQLMKEPRKVMEQLQEKINKKVAELKSLKDNLKATFDGNDLDKFREAHAKLYEAIKNVKEEPGVLESFGSFTLEGRIGNQQITETFDHEKGSLTLTQSGIDNPRDTAFRQGREEARKTFEQRTFDAVQGEDWQFIEKGEGANKTAGSPTLYRKVNIDVSGSSETYLVSYNPHEKSKVGIYIYNPKEGKWGGVDGKIVDQILSVVGNDVQKEYDAKMAQATADGTYATVQGQNDRNAVIGTFVRGGSLNTFNPQSPSWEGNTGIRDKISDKLKTVDAREAKEFTEIQTQVQTMEQALKNPESNKVDIETSISEINKRLKEVSPNTVEKFAKFEAKGYVKPQPHDVSGTYEYVQVRFEKGILVLTSNAEGSKEYEKKEKDDKTKLDSAKKALVDAVSSGKSNLVELGDVLAQKIREMLPTISPKNKASLEGFEVKGTIPYPGTDGKQTVIDVSFAYKNGQLWFRSDGNKTLTPNTEKPASTPSKLEGDPRDILESRVLGTHREWYDGTTVNRGNGKNEYVLSNANPKIAKQVVEKARNHGLRPRGNNGTDITVTITGYKEGFGFTGPDYKDVQDKPTAPDANTPDKLSTSTQRPATEKPTPSASETVEKSNVVRTFDGFDLDLSNPESVTKHLQYRFLQKYTKEEPTDKDQAYSNTTVGPIGKDAQGNNIYRISGYESNPDAKRTMERLLGKAKKHGLVPPDAKVSDAHQFDITVTGYERGFGYTGPYPRQEFPDKPTETTVERPAEKVEPPKTAPATQPVEQPKKDLQQSPTSVSKQTAKPSETGGEMKKPESTPASVSPSTAQRNTPMDTPKVPDASAPQSPRTRTETNTGVTTPTAVKPERMPEYRASSLPPKPVEEPGEKRIVAPGKILAKEAKVKREAVTKAIIEQQRASLEAQGWKYNPADDSYSVDSKGSFRVRYNPKKECWEIRENGGRYDYLQQWKKPDGTNVFSPIYKKTAEGIQAMNRALILTPTQIDQATGTEIDPQTNITSEELDGLRRDLVHLQSVRENREKDYDATYQSSRGIVDALIAEIEHIRQNPALIREKVVTQEQYDELIDKAKVYSDRNNMLVEMTKSMPDTKEKVVTSISAIHEALMKRIDEMIRVREQDMLKKSDELKNSSLFQSWHQGLTGSSPLQIEIDTLNSEVTNLRSVKRQMQYGGIKEDGPISRKVIIEQIEKARKNQNEENLPGSRVLDRQLKQDIEASARENVGATLDSLLRIRTLLQTINKVDADAGRKYEEDLEGIEVSKDVAVAIITLTAAAGGKATTLAGRVLSGARIGGLVSGSMSVKENYEEVQAGRKTVEQAVKGVAQDTTVGVGGGAVGGAIGHGLSKVKLPTRSPVTPGSAPVAPTGLRPVPPGPRGTTVTVESIKTNPRPPKIAGNLEGPPSKPRLTYREGAPVAPEQPQPKLREPATKKTTDGPKTDTPKTPKEQPRSAPKTTEKPATGPTPQRQEILKLETPKDAPIEILDLKTGKEIMGYNATGDIEIGKPLKIKVGSTSGKVETTKIVRKIVVEADGTMKITAGEGAGAETYQIMKMRRNHPSKGKAPERTSKPTTETEKTAKKESTKPDPKSQTKPPDDTPPPAGASPSPKGPETGPKSGGSGSKGGGGSPEKKSPTKGPTKKEPSSPKQTNSGPSNKGPEIVDAKLVALDPTKQVPSSGNMTLAEYLGVPSTADDKTVRTALTRMAGKVKNPDGSVVNSPQAKENWKIISKLLDSAKGSRANGKGSTISRKPPLSAQATLSQFIAL